MFKNKYRIIADTYSGYEAQIKYWFFPFWLQISRDGQSLGVNTFCNIEKAKLLINIHKNKGIFYEE